jgi:hypothetical protein
MTDQFCCDWAIPLVDRAGDVDHSGANNDRGVPASSGRLLARDVEGAVEPAVRT